LDQRFAADDRQKAADIAPKPRKNPSDQHFTADDRQQAAEMGLKSGQASAEPAVVGNGLRSTDESRTIVVELQD